MNTLVIIPAYNEEASILGVIQDVRTNAPEAAIVVVDDGSKDGTAKIARSRGVPVLVLPFNLGIGGAMQAGYRYAWEHDFDIAIQFDGDGQHMAAEIGVLLGPIEQGVADIVVGSRFLDRGRYRPPLFRKMGIWIFSKVISSILGMSVTDTTSGFRAADRRVIRFFAEKYPEDYPEVESLVLLHRAGMQIREVAAEMRDRTCGRSSITPLRSAYYMVKVLLAVFIDLLKKG